MTSFLSFDDLRRRGILTSKSHSLQYCLDVGILRPHHFCEDCQSYMTLKVCPTSKYRDGYNWTCGDTQHCVSVRSGSILQNRSIPFSSFIHLLWLFCNQINVSNVARLLTLNMKTVRSLFKSILQCVAEDLLENSITGKIGGPGYIVEVEESNVGKRKYNRSGRCAVGEWVLGGYCRTTGDSFLVECPGKKPDRHILTLLIKKHVLPGTVILTDKLKGYNSLSHHGFIHFVVNHRRGFVDPVTGVNTNICEGMWFYAKHQMRLATGHSRTDTSSLAISLCIFMWMKKLNLTRTEPSIRQTFNKELPELMRRILN